MSNNDNEKNKAISVENEINDENLTEVAGGNAYLGTKHMVTCANCRAVLPKVGAGQSYTNALVCPKCGGKNFNPVGRSYNGGSANQGR